MISQFDLYDKLNITNSQFSKTIKSRTWYRTPEEDTWYNKRKYKTHHRSVEEIISTFTNDIEYEKNGIYRNHAKELTDYQKEWQKTLMQDDYSFFLSIKLPWRDLSGFIRTKNRKNAIKLYKRLIKEIQIIVINKKDHWTRKGVPFCGVLEHGDEDDGFWHVHLAIKTTENDDYIGYKLCEAISTIVNKYGFYKTVFDLRCVYDKEGLCAYIVKELTPKIEDKKKHVNEGSELFTMKTWFGSKKFKPYKVNYFDINQLRNIIAFALWLKQHGDLSWPNPINKLRRTLTRKSIHYIGDRGKRKIQPTTNFDLFGRSIILLDSV